MKRTSTLILMLLVMEGPAHAGVWLQTGLSLTRATESQGASELTDTRYLSSSTLGYSFLQGFVLGVQGIYSQATGGGSQSHAFGPKGGLLIKGFELSAAYLPIARENAPGLKRDGAGFALNLGYTFQVAGPFRAGLYGVFWSMTFTDENDQKLAAKITSTQLSPQLSLALDL